LAQALFGSRARVGGGAGPLALNPVAWATMAAPAPFAPAPPYSGTSGPYPAPPYSGASGPYPAPPYSGVSSPYSAQAFSPADAAPFAAAAAPFMAPFAAAATPFAAAGAQHMAKQAEAEIEQDVNKKMRKLFGIPMEAGPATPYMLRMRHWMHIVLGIQLGLCGIRFAILLDIMGGFWMVLVCGIGWYAWWRNMNITYVSAWGFACLINGIFDVLGVVIPLAFDAFNMNFIMSLIRISIPASELIGAAFAWHLHHDYMSGIGHQAMGDDPWSAPGNGEAAPLMGQPGSSRIKKATACC